MAEERRLVTVLFADIAGSTALGEQVDPEDMRALLGRFYATARDVVTTHGGTLEKFIGDAIMAVFGLPQAHGDDAERALAAALELRDRIRSDAALGDRLPVRIGVNTGEVVAARDTAAGDFLVTGDAVNVAARLQQAGEPWTILCGERTARAAARGFMFGSALEIAVKGKQQGVIARPVTSRLAVAMPVRVPLIGRDPDLAQLELVARRTFTERRPFLVSLIAAAGTGKTRLLEEFLDRLPAVATQAIVATAQCLPYGQRLTYWPLRAVLFRLAGLVEDADVEAIREGIRRWVEASGVAASQRVSDLLATTVGAGEAEAIDQSSLFAAWRATIEAAARRSPLIVVFEDLHWSSDSLLDLVEFVMQPRGDVPLLMIALARPELLDRRPAWGGGRRNYISLALEPLSDGAVAELVGYLAGPVTPEIVERIVVRAEGNPFYAGEIIRSVMERTPSLRDAGAVEHALATLPDTVQATVLARLDLLQPDERRVLQLGAVFGRAFSSRGVAVVAPDLAGETDRLADGLVAKDLIRPANENEFIFRHILIREVAYSTLPRGERARLHAAAGRWLEDHAAGREDGLAELIAYHFREAAVLSRTLTADGNAGGIRRGAVHWLTRAADVAAAGAALVEAARHLRAAIDLAERDNLPELYERLGDVGTSGNARVAAFRLALDLCRELGRPPDQELRLVAQTLTTLMRWQASVETRPSSEEIAGLRAAGRALLERASDVRSIALFLITDGFYPFWQQGNVTAAELAEATRSAQRGLEMAERLGDINLQSAALDALGSCAGIRGSRRDEREFARRRLTFEDHLDYIERIDAYQVVVWDSILLGDLDDADRVSAAGLAPIQPGQIPSWALGLLTWRIYALTLLGRWDEALAAAERAQQLWNEIGRVPAGYSVRGFVAAFDVATAREEDVLAGRYREILEEILDQFDTDTPFGLMRPYPKGDLDALEAQIIGQFLLARVRIELVERALSLCTDRRRILAPDGLTRILEHAVSQHLLVLEAQARRALGMARQDPAELARALEIFARSGAAPYAARVRCERALLTGDQGDLAGGLKVLEGLGDLDQIGRIEQALRK